MLENVLPFVVGAGATGLVTILGIWWQSKFVLRNKIKEEVAKKWVKAHAEASEIIENLKGMIPEDTGEGVYNYYFDTQTKNKINNLIINHWFYYNKNFFSPKLRNCWEEIDAAIGSINKMHRARPKTIELDSQAFQITQRVKDLATKAQEYIMEALYNKKNWSIGGKREMNKKQLIIAWIMGLLISLCILSSSIHIEKEKIYREPTEKEINEIKKKEEKGGTSFADLPVWTGEYRKVFKRIDIGGVVISVLMLGGLGIYTLRSKKK